MIRTRYVAAAAAIAVAGSSLALAAPASAAPSTLTFSGGSTLYTGANSTLTVDLDNTETGAYTLDLMKGEVKVATVATGTDVAGLATVKWTIPASTKLVSTGLNLELKSTATTPAWTAIESSSFAIAQSTITGIQLQTPAEEPEDPEEEPGDPTPVTTAAAGSTHQLAWTKAGATGAKVKVDLVQKIDGKDKRIPLLKETANDGLEDVTIPAAAVANTTTRIEITPSNKSAIFGKSADFAITGVSGGAVKAVALGDDAGDTALTTIRNGDKVTIAYTATAAVQLDLYLEDTTKPAAKIVKSDTGGSYDFEIPAKLAAGNYFVRATVVGVKPAVTVDSAEFAVAQPAYTVVDPTGPFNQGETVTVTWTSNGRADSSTGPVTVSLVAGDKVTKIDTKAVTTNGAGSLEFVIPAKQAAGTTYKVRVSNNNVKEADGTYDDSATFTIAANSTVVS
jgi:hypothetical protein